MNVVAEKIISKLYDIALDPRSLENFIDVWTEAGLDSAQAHQTVEAIYGFDDIHQEHLTRAQTFLERGELADQPSDLASILRPFDNLAAFIIDETFRVIIGNDGAQHYFGLHSGQKLDDAKFPTEPRQILEEKLEQIFHAQDDARAVIKNHTGESDTPLVMQVQRLSARSAQGHVLALVVTARYQWNMALGPTLGEVFGLTPAEQDVVRLLVEGQNVKEIALRRNTSEGTVRGQLKTILSKMNARSQSEIIRLVVYLQAVSSPVSEGAIAPKSTGHSVAPGWLEREVWKPFHTVTLPDGRRLDYHEMGPPNGAPILYSHMGYCMARWHAPMIKLAFKHRLRVICPIRAGYGHSDNIDPKADVVAATRADTLFLMDRLGLSKVPYVVQGNDLVFAIDLAVHNPERVSEIIGLGARPFLHGDMQYAGMSKWHRFFISTAKHSPHLLRFTARACVSLMRRIGVEAMFRNAHQTSAADMAIDGNQAVMDIMTANAELIASATTDASQAYTQELIVTETPWDDLIFAAKDTPTWFICGADDPLMDIAAIAAYRETYPWIDIEVIQNAGQMLIYQHFETILPRLAKAANAAQK